MSEVLATVVALAALGLHAVQAREWARERARLVSAAVATTPAATAAALLREPPAKRGDEEPARRRVVPIGDGG